MSHCPPVFLWLNRLSYDWTSDEGLATLKNTAISILGYEPQAFQVLDSAYILSGRDVLCITATGDGKYPLIDIPALVYRGMITVVIEPTNFLKNDMVSRLQALGVHAVVINTETLHAATRNGREEQAHMSISSVENH